MNIDAWPSSAALNPVYTRIRDLKLEDNLFELNTQGLTVVRNAIPEDVVDRAKNAILKIADARGLLTQPADDSRPSQYRGVGVLLHYLLFEDEIFEQLLMNPLALALIDYLLGRSCVLSSCTGMLKGPNDERSTLHTDNGMIPSPFSEYALVANATWVLTDYSKDGGCLLYVPGSHLLCRHPTADERSDESICKAVEVPKGSLVVWHGNLWHGAFPRRQEDLRINLIMLYCRMCCITQEDYAGRFPPESLERQDPRFATLMGQHIAYGWTEAGPDFSHHDRLKYLGLHRSADEHLFD